MRRHNLHMMADSDYLPEIEAKLRDAGYPINTQALNALAPAELVRWRAREGARAAAMENLNFQYTLGLLEADHYQNVTIPAIQAAAPIWRELDIRGLSPRFQAEIDQVLSESEENEQ